MITSALIDNLFKLKIGKNMSTQNNRVLVSKMILTVEYLVQVDIVYVLGLT